MRRPAPQPSMVSGYVKPPLGGLNTVDPIGELPATDAAALVNLIPAEYGLRARLGWSEWCTTVDSSGPVLTLLAFNGAASSNDKLFAVTKNGIWDVTSTSSSPSQLVTFGTTSGSAGIGSACSMVSSAGHFLAYCDEENGYYLWTESLAAWQKVQDIDTTTAWQALTGYTIGDYVKNGGNVYLCTQTGTSAGSGGPTGTGTAISDGTCTWNFNQSVSGVDPANFVHVLSWKNRLWFTQKATAKAWYLGLNAIGGTATAFNFGGQFRSGGQLVGLWNWTTDGGAGMDNYLISLSQGGDVAIYQGTDPSSASTFGLKGVWTVGALPVGRNVATTLGGDVIIASLAGLVKVSDLVVGKLVVGDRSQYLTAKVQNLFNLYTSSYGSNTGWALKLDPKENALLVLVPQVSGQPTIQLAMSLATRGWFPFSGLSMNCAESWNGTLYYGTSDGKVIAHTGYVDGVTLSSPTASTPVQWSYVSSFSNLGTPNLKQIQLLRVKVMSTGGQPPLQARAAYDFDLTGLPPTAGAIVARGALWDSAIWDSAFWSGDYNTSQTIFGGFGIGSHIAVAVAGLANSRTILAGVDVGYTQGGWL